MAKRKLPKYDEGGFLKNAGQLGMNMLRGSGDTALTALGAGNVIPDSAYTGPGSQFFKGYANTIGGVGKAILPTAANIIAPGSGQFVGAAQGAISQFNPQQQQAPMNQQIYANQGAMYPNGGQVPPDSTMRIMPNMSRLPMMPNAEVELQENTLNPDGSTNQYNGPSHAQGGIGTNLPTGAKVFSDRLKMGNKTFAELNKKNNTDKEQKILDNAKATKESKLTAKIMQSTKNRLSDQLFEAQEQLKMKKLGKYAERLGIDQLPMQSQSQELRGPGMQPVPQGPNQGSGFENHPLRWGNSFAYGGVKKYGMGDMVDGEPVYHPNQFDQLPNGIMGSGYNPGAYDNAMGKGGNPAPNPTAYSDEDLFNNFSALTAQNKPTAPVAGAGVPWGTLGQIGGQALTAIGNNIGNIYDLKRAQTVDKEAYNRVAPAYLDPTAALQLNKEQAAMGRQNIRTASNGNSSTYLNNAKSLAINTMAADDRIRRDYANQNAGIQNQANYYNAGTGDRETIANMQNQAQSRNLKSNAYANIGQNVMGQVGDNNKRNRDSEYLKVIAARYPEIMKDPELAKLFK